MKNHILTCILAFFIPVFSTNATSRTDKADSTDNAGHIDTVVVMDSFRYVGEYPEGEGVWFSEKRGIIKGHFPNGHPEGICTHYDMKGRKYVGQFTVGHPTGYGKLFYPNGDISTGWFENGKLWGQDTIYYKDRIYIGLYANGNRVEKKGRYYRKTAEEMLPCRPEFDGIRLTADELAFMSLTRQNREQNNRAGRIL